MLTNYVMKRSGQSMARANFPLIFSRLHKPPPEDPTAARMVVIREFEPGQGVNFVFTATKDLQ